MKKVLVCLYILCISTSIVAQVNQLDSLSLIDLFNNTNGTEWYNKTNWLTDKPVSTWFGVSVDSGRVVKLFLSNYTPNGGSESNNLIGTIPSTISNLSALKSLGLSNNRLTGSIPSTIANLKNLQELYLSADSLKGNIPAELGNLSNLQYLDLSSNQLTGSIPPKIGSLTNLQELYLSYNFLSGNIPAELGNLSILKYLLLGGNFLEGIIPGSFRSLKNLSVLTLNENKLQSVIPLSMSELEKLNYLDISNNNFVFDTGFVHIAKISSENQDKFEIYSPQGNLKIKTTEFSGDTMLSVSAGGLFNTTYEWYRNNIFDTIIYRDSTYHIAGGGEYYVKVKHPDASELILYSDTVKIAGNTCLNFQHPVANFNYAIAGLNVSFNNTSSKYNSSLWKFGDGDSSTLSSPFHYYKTHNNNTCLTVSNACFQDIVCKTISLPLLTSIKTNHGGNGGSISVQINGNGFIPGIKFFLHKNGEVIFFSDTLQISKDSANVQTTFDLKGKSIGFWNVVAVLPNGTSDTLYNSFLIEPVIKPKLWVNITGDNILRVGFNQIYTITYGNEGNVDATLVPLLIAGLPFGTEIEILKPLFRVDSLPGFDSLHYSQDSIKNTFIDSVTNTSFSIYYIDKIPAGSTNTLAFIFHLPQTVTLHSFPTIRVLLGTAQYDSDNKINTGREVNSAKSSSIENFLNCYMSIVDLGAMVFLDLTNAKQIDKCVTGVTSVSRNLFNSYSQKAASGGGRILSASSAFAGTYQTVGSCLVAASVAFPPSRIVKAIDIAMNASNYALSGLSVINNCSQKDAENALHPIIGNAWDPNEKYGPGDSITGYYLNKIYPLCYTIGFENAPAANLNAQTVNVTDTLNSKYFDISSFGFTSVSVGDSIYVLNYPEKSFFHDFDFTSQFGVKARVTATFDTLTGVALCQFQTINPVTNQATNNALDGFLPPDTTSPKGQGYVSYTARPNKKIGTNDSILNKATIVFDANSPITTSTWKNFFDLVSPKSKTHELPAVQNDENFVVNWFGTDNLSGIIYYDVYVSINDSAFIPWLVYSNSTSASYFGKFGNKYSFYSIATDKAGNREEAKNEAEATTLLSNILPVKLTNLKTNCIGYDAEIEWETLFELNTKYFEVQKQEASSYTWSPITWISATGNTSTIKKYEFTDKEGGTSLYRLRIADNDGNFTFSEAIKSNCVSSAPQLRVFPIPSKNEINISLRSTNKKNVKFEVIDLYGKVVKEMTQILQQGNNQFKLNTSNLSSGQYILKVNGVEGLTPRKITIIR